MFHVCLSMFPMGFSTQPDAAKRQQPRSPRLWSFKVRLVHQVGQGGGGQQPRSGRRTRRLIRLKRNSLR